MPTYQYYMANELQREKTYLLTCAPSKDSNRPAHSRSPIRVFVIRQKEIVHHWFKGSIFHGNRHFIIQERFNKLLYGINIIMKCGT